MNINIRSIKILLKHLEATPLHPQWLALRHRRHTAAWLKKHANGTLIDIGCGNSIARKLMPDDVNYIGVDYPATMTLGYSGKPDILADAASLPFRNNSADCIIILDVLEHLPQPDSALSEASRVLRKGGLCLIHVPFLYPLHDEPYDFQRWTHHGLTRLLTHHGFTSVEIKETTNSLETAASLLSIALAIGSFNALKEHSLRALLTPFAIAMVPFVNVLGWLFGKLLPTTRLMPISYLVVAYT